MKNNMQRTNVFLSERQRQALQALAEERETSMAELIRQAIRDFLAKRKSA